LLSSSGKGCDWATPVFLGKCCEGFGGSADMSRGNRRREIITTTTLTYSAGRRGWVWETLEAGRMTTTTAHTDSKHERFALANTANNSQPHPSRRTLVQKTTLNLAAGRRGPSPSPSYCSCLWRWWQRLLLLLLLRVANDPADALVQLLVQRVVHLAGVAAAC